MARNQIPTSNLNEAVKLTQEISERVNRLNQLGFQYTFESSSKPHQAKKQTRAQKKKAKTAQKKVPTRRGKYSKTGEEFLVGILADQARKGAELRNRWNKSGRGGTADNVLHKLVKQGKVTRTRNEGERDSTYALA